MRMGSTMGKEDDEQIGEWCERHGLTGETQRVLWQEGFTSFQFLRLLTPEEVDKWFKQRRLLPLAQCLVLQQAVAVFRHPLLCAGAVGGGDEELEAACPPAARFSPAEPQHRNTYNTVPITQQQQQQQQQKFAEDLSSTSLVDQKGATAVARPSHFQKEEEESLRFLLVGKTGSGKSTTGNSILGADLFDEDVGFDSQTYSCQLKRATVHGRTIEIMDSPGLFDTNRTHEEIAVDIVTAVAGMHPGPHAFLYVIKLGRYTEEEYEVYTRLKALFDHDVTNYVIVIFTGGDGLEKEGKDIGEILKKVPYNLHQVLQECQHRLVVFNNVAHDKQQYVMNLLHEVDRMLAGNSRRYYACPRYAEVGLGMEEEVARRLNEMEQEQLADKPYVQELKKKVHSAEEELQEMRQLFKQREQERQRELQATIQRADAERKALVDKTKNEDYAVEQQSAEKQRLLKIYEKQRETLEREMERQKEEEKKDLERKEKELQAVISKEEEELQRVLEKKQKEHQRKIAQLKDAIVTNQKPTFLEKIIDGTKEIVVSLLPHAAKAVASLLSKEQK